MMFDHESPNMDNFEMKLVSRCISHFDTVFPILFGLVSAYRIKGVKGDNIVTHCKVSTNELRLQWHHQDSCCGYEKLPFPLDEAGARQYCLSWLKGAEYGRQPDHDGDSTPGFSIEIEEYGRNILVKPVWAMHGK